VARPPAAASPAPTRAGGSRPRAAPESCGGAVPLGSRYYVARAADEEFLEGIASGETIVLVSGARQMGKTSLLARGLAAARESGSRVALTDFQWLNAEQMESADRLFRSLAGALADQLELDVAPEACWSSERGASVNFQRYVRREVLPRCGTLVWGLDEIDRLFTCPFGTEVFGLFRSWHNARALDPAGPWSQLTLAIAYATEAHLFITDLNQSPFNVGLRVALEDFTPAEVADLNARYGSPLPSPAHAARFYELLGGHPYLTRRGLHELASRRLSLDELEVSVACESGPFGDHLRRILVLLAHEEGLAEVVRCLLRGGARPPSEAFYRLRSAGVVAGDSPRRARLRCRLYAAYLEGHLF
jgi:hypothetical protein